MIHRMLLRGSFISGEWADFQFWDSEKKEILFLVPFDLLASSARSQPSSGLCVQAPHSQHASWKRENSCTSKSLCSASLWVFECSPPEEALIIFSSPLPSSSTPSPLLSIFIRLRGKPLNTSRTSWCLCWESSTAQSSPWVESTPWSWVHALSYFAAEQSSFSSTRRVDCDTQSMWATPYLV